MLSKKIKDFSDNIVFYSEMIQITTNRKITEVLNIN